MSNLLDHLFDDRSNEGFVDLHGRLLTLVDVVFFEADGIHDADDDAVDRQFSRFGSESSAASLRDQDHVSDSGPEGIDGNERATGGDQSVSILGFHPIGLDDEQLVAGHRFDLLGGDHRAGDFCNKHGKVPLPLLGLRFSNRFDGLSRDDEFFIRGYDPQLCFASCCVVDATFLVSCTILGFA